MTKTAHKATMKARRQRRIRATVSGTAARPRLAIYKSNRAIGAQLINDESGMSLAQVVSRALPAAAKKKPTEAAHEVGKAIAKKAKEAGVDACVFDRGGYQYRGAVAAVAEGAREGGLAV